jgi:regulator of nucleoside diphosphate kinase
MHAEPSCPDIIVSHEDHEQLVELALQALDRAPGAVTLLREMERAKVVDAKELPAGAVAMNARVDFEYDGSRYRDFRLVYPQCADIAEGRISVLTPVGAALIGLSEGQSMWWPGSAGRIHRLTVTAAAPPQRAESM